MVDARRKPVLNRNVRVVVSSAATTHWMILISNKLQPETTLVHIYTAHTVTTALDLALGLRGTCSTCCIASFRRNNNNGGIIISQPHEQAQTHFQVPPPDQLVVEALANEAGLITNSASSLLETGQPSSQNGALNSYFITPPASSMIMEAIPPEYSRPPMKYTMPDQHYYPTQNNGVFGNTTVSTTYGDLSGVIINNNNNLQQEVVTTQQQGFHLSTENGAGFDLDNISELQIDELLKDVYHLIN